MSLKRKNWKKILKSCGCHYRLIFILLTLIIKIMAASLCLSADVYPAPTVYWILH